jgi:hypothetical protein
MSISRYVDKQNDNNLSEYKLRIEQDMAELKFCGMQKIGRTTGELVWPHLH